MKIKYTTIFAFLILLLRRPKKLVLIVEGKFLGFIYMYCTEGV